MNYSVHNIIGIGESQIEFTVHAPIVSTSADAHKRCHALSYGVYVSLSSQVIFFFHFFGTIKGSQDCLLIIIKWILFDNTNS